MEFKARISVALLQYNNKINNNNNNCGCYVAWALLRLQNEKNNIEQDMLLAIE